MHVFYIYHTYYKLIAYRWVLSPFLTKRKEEKKNATKGKSWCALKLMCVRISRSKHLRKPNLRNNKFKYALWYSCGICHLFDEYYRCFRSLLSECPPAFYLLLLFLLFLKPVSLMFAESTSHLSTPIDVCMCQYIYIIKCVVHPSRVPITYHTIYYQFANICIHIALVFNLPVFFLGNFVVLPLKSTTCEME